MHMESLFLYILQLVPFYYVHHHDHFLFNQNNFVAYIIMHWPPKKKRASTTATQNHMSVCLCLLQHHGPSRAVPRRMLSGKKTMCLFLACYYFARSFILFGCLTKLCSAHTIDTCLCFVGNVFILFKADHTRIHKHMLVRLRKNSTLTVSNDVSELCVFR